MSCISVNALEKGMILSEDVLDINARLLLSKGQQITPKHIRILKVWGIIDVNVVGDKGCTEPEASFVDPEIVEAVKVSTREIFKNVDLEHPALEEIFKLSVDYRSRNHSPHPGEAVRFQVNENAGNSSKLNIRERIKTLNIRLPEIPSIVNELNDITADPYASANDIAEIVNKSPSLTAVLLKIVNSAFYGLLNNVSSLDHALVILGFDEVKNIVLGFSIQNFFNKDATTIDRQRFWKHSIICSQIAKFLGRHFNIVDDGHRITL